MKKFAAILLSTLLILSLSACGNSSQNREEDASAESVTTASDAETEESGEYNADQDTESAEQNTEGM